MMFVRVAVLSNFNKQTNNRNANMTGSHLTLGSPASLNPSWQYKTHGAPGVLDRGGGGGRQTVERGESVLCSVVQSVQSSVFPVWV